MTLACLVCRSVDSPSQSFRSYSISSSDNEGRCSAIVCCLNRKVSEAANTMVTSKVTPQPFITNSQGIAGTPRLVRSRAVRRDFVSEWNFDEFVVEGQRRTQNLFAEHGTSFYSVSGLDKSKDCACAYFFRWCTFCFPDMRLSFVVQYFCFVFNFFFLSLFHTTVCPFFLCQKKQLDPHSQRICGSTSNHIINPDWKLLLTSFHCFSFFCSFRSKIHCCIKIR